jgi:hypothetical protein
MNTKATQGKKTTIFSQNPLETDRKQAGAHKPRRAPSAGVLDQLLGRYDKGEANDEFDDFYGEGRVQKAPQRKEFTVFRQEVYHEQVNVKREIEALTHEIRRMVEVIKTQDSALMNDVKDAQKAVLEAQPEESGIYHVRFLEVILKLLKSIREKISDSRTWLEAMTSKRAKRGSLFAARSKKKGTQYSLSQELSNARSVQ